MQMFILRTKDESNPQAFYYTFAVHKSHLGRQLRTECNEYCETCSMCVVREEKMNVGEGTCVAYADVCTALCIVFQVDSCFELQ